MGGTLNPPAIWCPTAVGCTNPTGVHGVYDKCGSARKKCQSGSWVAAAETAAACTSPAGAHNAHTGSGSTRKKCNNCVWEDDPQIACSCTNGTPVTGLSCTAQQSSKCASCTAGFRLDGTSCTACSTITNAAAVTCTNGSSSTVESCNTGYKKSGNACNPCTANTANTGTDKPCKTAGAAADGCAGTTTFLVCKEANVGNWIDSGVAKACTKNQAGCTTHGAACGTTTATASKRVCTAPAAGYHIVDGAATACTQQTGCQTSGTTCSSTEVGKLTCTKVETDYVLRADGSVTSKGSAGKKAGDDDLFIDMEASSAFDHTGLFFVTVLLLATLA